MAFPHILKKEDKGVYQIQISIDFIDLCLPWLAYQRSPLRYRHQAIHQWKTFLIYNGMTLYYMNPVSLLSPFFPYISLFICFSILICLLFFSFLCFTVLSLALCRANHTLREESTISLIYLLCNPFLITFPECLQANSCYFVVNLLICCPHPNRKLRQFASTFFILLKLPISGKMVVKQSQEAFV